jgi:hypothetical protein
LFRHPLSGDIRRQQRECGDKSDYNYKKQLFGHSAHLGVIGRLYVTAAPK